MKNWNRIENLIRREFRKDSIITFDKNYKQKAYKIIESVINYLYSEFYPNSPKIEELEQELHRLKKLGDF